MGEIKIETAPINRALNDLSTAGQAFNGEFSKELQGDNELSLADKIDEINQYYEKIKQTYQQLLTSNIASTRRAVEVMNEKDEEIAVSMQIPK